MEEEMANRQAELPSTSSCRRTSSCNAKPRSTHNVYQEILQATDYFCKQHGIDMVLRFNGEQSTCNRPDSVMNFINQPVVWYDRAWTSPILFLQDLNRTAINPATADQPAPPSPSAAIAAQQRWRRRCPLRRAKDGRPDGRRSSFHSVMDDWHLGMYLHEISER